MATRNFIHLFVILAISISPQVNAAIPDYSDNLREFSLTAEHRDSQFIFPTNSLKTGFDSLWINWYEAFTTYFDAGIEIGNFEMTQASNSLASARFTKGQFAGLLLRFTPYQSNHFDLTLHINYRYNQSTGTSLTQSSQFAWHQSLVSAEIALPLSDVFRVFAAIEVPQISGEQRDSGPVTKITSFSQEKAPNYRLGLDFRSNRHNIIRLNWITGVIEGASINFVYKF